MKRFIVVSAGLTLGLALAFASKQNAGVTAHSFDTPVDGVSIALTDWATHRVRGYTEDGWTEWQDLARAEERPDVEESNLVVFPRAVAKIEIDTTVASENIHPVSISDEPVSYLEAATHPSGTPRILSREEWKADESFLYTSKPATPKPAEDKENDSTEAPSAVSQRVKDCQEAQLNYPNEFKVAKTVTKNADGQVYRWPLQYSKSVKMLVVHHTAMSENGRSGAELMRALYQYHANSNGWGDVGYHYVIDSEGQIYEGKVGGKNVVAGHAYCNNIGTISVSLMGNFENNEPTQDMMKSLKWLLDDLADEYDIDPAKNVTFHGVSRPTIVGHGDLLSTECPGYYVHGALDQIRQHVADGELTALVRFPAPRAGRQSSKEWANKAASRAAARGGSASISSRGSMFEEGLSALGQTNIQGRPGDSVLLSLRYVAGPEGTMRKKNIGKIQRSVGDIGVWQLIDGAYVRARGDIITTEAIPDNGSTQIQMKIQMPAMQGTHTLALGDAVFTLSVSGRSTDARQRSSTATVTSSRRSVSSRAVIIRPSSSRSSVSSRPAVSRSSASRVATASPSIRIRLSHAENDASVTLSNGDIFSLGNDGSRCVVMQGNRAYDEGIVRLGSLDGSFTVSTWKTSYNRFRGILECRVIDGQLALINELSLDDYMAGISEEPDTEPYEKQRAFAIAARTYAAWYMDPDHRKFPGMPYDGSDSPAIFQKYSGMNYEPQHPSWIKAVQDTHNMVIKKDGQVIKPPYFSSDDGRTRSPAEAGWKNFPFAEIFASKKDPWCEGMTLRGHGVGMSGCGAEAQANEGKKAEEILEYYYPGTRLESL